MTSDRLSLSHPKYRPDIDGLRAVAVLAVVGSHAFPQWVPGGLIGVDVFFVISGFLISNIIFENLDRGGFDFAAFYARRIRRIFPALTLMLAVSISIGWFVLLPEEYQQLGKHVAAGTGFVSNFALWWEAGYFDKSAELKPLLHLWSLGIEEQFYLLWPPIAWLAWKRKFNVLALMLTLAVLSFGMNLFWIRQDAVATFFSPLTRFWELLAGGILAWAGLHAPAAIRRAALREPASLAGAAALAFGFWRIDRDLAFPGWWAVLPVMGAVLVIAAGPHAWINRTLLSNRIAIWFGLISFPLYLWHWPLLSFARIFEGGTPSLGVRIALVALSIALAWVTWRFVERPLRAEGNGARKVAILVTAAALAGVAGLATYRSDGFARQRFTASELSVARAMLPKFTGEYVVRRFGELSNAEFDEADPRPKLLIVGDSYAQDLVNAIFEGDLGGRVQVVTRQASNVCGNLFVPHQAFAAHIPANLTDVCAKMRLYEDENLRARMRQADAVWFAGSWLDWHVPYLAVSLSNARELTGRPVLVFGRKSLGAVSPRTLVKMSERERLHLRNAVSDWQADMNTAMKAVVPADAFVDVQAILCGDAVASCAPFTKDGRLITYDGAHLTPDGARLYGEGLMQNALALTSLGLEKRQ